jgi:hypothetical protein
MAQTAIVCASQRPTQSHSNRQYLQQNTGIETALWRLRHNTASVCFSEYFGRPRRDHDRGVTVTPDAFFRMDAGLARRYRRCPMTMSDRKRAETYLAASGAVPISVTRRDGVCSIHAGRAGAHGDVVSTQWINEAQAIAVTREARRYAGDRPDGPTAAEALARAAASQRPTLTADHVAIERAGAAAEKVDVANAALPKYVNLKSDATMAAMRATSACDSLSVNDVVEQVRHLRPLLRWRAGSRWRGRRLRIPKS